LWINHISSRRIIRLRSTKARDISFEHFADGGEGRLARRDVKKDPTLNMELNPKNTVTDNLQNITPLSSQIQLQLVK
jgi:hypothetical protein